MLLFIKYSETPPRKKQVTTSLRIVRLGDGLVQIKFATANNAFLMVTGNITNAVYKDRLIRSLFVTETCAINKSCFNVRYDVPQLSKIKIQKYLASKATCFLCPIYGMSVN